MTIYDRVKTICKKNSVTVAELERQLRMPSGTYRRWNRGHFPNINEVKRLAIHFGVPMEYFMEGVTDNW